MAQNSFSVSMNTYTWGRFDVAQCLAQVRETPIRLVELPAEQIRPNSLIPELMVDAPLGGEWRYSLPDLKELLAQGGFTAESVDVFGYTGYPGAEGLIRRRIDFAQALGAGIVVVGYHHKAWQSVANVPGAAEPPEIATARAFAYRMLREVADYAADRGVRLALEIHGASWPTRLKRSGR